MVRRGSLAALGEDELDEADGNIAMLGPLDQGNRIG
jgi:hypothetical protein